MRRVMMLALGCGLIGCTKDADDSGDTDVEACEPGSFACYINLTVAPVGDLACYNPGDAFIEQTVDTTLQVSESRTDEVVEDTTEDGKYYPEATVDFWLDDDASGAPDFSVAADDSAYVDFTAPACTPITYRTRTPAAAELTKDTYEAHQIYTPVATGDKFPFNAVSRTTYLIIPNLMGITVDPTASIVAGTIYDCDGEPVEGAQVIAKDANGDTPDELVVKYFVEKFPNRDQPHTSPDGRWVAINLPPGRWTIEAWVSDGAGGHELIGATVLQAYADSINISNITTGYDDGVVYPDACLVP